MSSAGSSKLPRAFARKAEGGASGGAHGAPETEATIESGEERPVVCLACGHALTLAKHAISVAGSHTHTFMNPNGFVFEIACYSEAPGTRPAGSPSNEWSWFPGHVWQVALCGACRAHVGWSFRGDGGGHFGLVRDRIGEGGAGD